MLPSNVCIIDRAATFGKSKLHCPLWSFGSVPNYSMNHFPKEVLSFSQLFGGFALDVSSDPKKNKRGARFSLPLFLWGLVFNAIQVMVTVLGLYTDYVGKLAGHPVRMVSDNAYLVVLLDLLPLNMTSAVMFCSCSWKYQRFIRVLDILEDVGRNLQQDLPEVKAKVKVFIVCIVNVSFIVSNSVLSCTARPSVSRQDQFKSLCYTPALIMYFAQAALFLQFTQVAQSIAVRFRAINVKIKEELIRTRSEQGVIRGSPSGGRSLSTCRVKSLMDTYWLLCEAVQQANIFYGDQLMASFFTSVVHVTITLYYFFLLLMHGRTVIAIVDAAWIIAHVTHLVLMVRPSALVTEMADETAPMICKLINVDLDPTLVELLEGVLVQLRKHNGRFSALGCFPISNSTLTGTAGAVITYVVVMIQFHAIKN
ncbi:gustatory receptor [Homalodisca vitripennis]|nr:gustatory receptor [Homalodisca vitripennis]